MTGTAAATPLVRQLSERIRRQGPLAFSEYMRACLYHPEFGYYSRVDAPRFADFYTSVDVHPIFGRLLARQLAEMWRALGCPAEFQAVECGAGTGRLAAHILDFSAHVLGDFYASLRYVAVEQSAARRAAHAQSLASHLSRGRVTSSSELPREIPAGCILSNELLDALPVHRVVMKGGELREVYVALREETLVEQLGSLSTPEVASYFKEQETVMRESQQAEANLDACRWIQEAGQTLHRGFVLTIDYGHEAAELYNERHMRGTLLAYSRHKVSEDFLRAPGEQDLTAHVNFTALDLWGRRTGLARAGLVSQMAFLLAWGRTNDFADLYEPGASEVDRLRARLLLKTLIHPEGMGETFHVCIQHKGVPEAALTGLAGL